MKERVVCWLAPVTCRPTSSADNIICHAEIIWSASDWHCCANKCRIFVRSIVLQCRTCFACCRLNQELIEQFSTLLNHLNSVKLSCICAAFWTQKIYWLQRHHYKMLQDYFTQSDDTHVSADYRVYFQYACQNVVILCMQNWPLLQN